MKKNNKKDEMDLNPMQRGRLKILLMSEQVTTVEKTVKILSTISQVEVCTFSQLSRDSETAYDLVIIAGDKGLEVLSALRHQNQIQRPVILYGSQLSPIDRVRARELGVISMVDPSEKEGELYATIRNTIKFGISRINAERTAFEKEIISVLKTLYAQNPGLRVEDLCKQMQLSSSTLYRKVKEAFHESPNRLITVFRMECALELLKEESLNISQIAYTCGFSSATYFTRVFKQFYGVTPGQYRKDKSLSAQIVRIFE